MPDKSLPNKLNTFAEVRALTSPKYKVFTCALLQRMLPNYVLFSELNEFGSKDSARKIMALLWEWSMSPKISFNAGLQSEKFEQHIPDINDFDNYGVYPALDFCVAIDCTLQACDEQHDNIAVTVSKLSQGTVEAYVRATSDTDLDGRQIKAHPLMAHEIETQQALLNHVKDNEMNKEFILELKRELEQENTSNLGIVLE